MENFKLESLAMWLQARPGSSCGASYWDKLYHARVNVGGREFVGAGRTIERAFAQAIMTAEGAGSTLAFVSPALDEVVTL